MSDRLIAGAVTPEDVCCPPALQRPPLAHKIQPDRYYPDGFGNIWKFKRHLDGCDYCMQMVCVERGEDSVEFAGQWWENRYQVGNPNTYRKDGAFGLTRPLPHDLKGPVPYVSPTQPNTEHEHD